MAGRALLALLGLCVGLVAGAQDGVWQGFDLLKFSGLWYEIAVASKTGPQSPPPRMKTGAVLVELEGSRLALTAAYYDENTCVKEKDGASLGDGLGKFKVIRTARDKEVQVVATDYEAYAILDLSSHRGGVAWRVLKLYSRSLEDKGEVMKRFLEVAQERGFTESDVHLLERDLTCVKLLQPGGVPSS